MQDRTDATAGARRWMWSSWVIVAVVVGAVVALGRPMSAASPTPYSGTPIAIPGTIPGERFDNGGEGVAYYDLSAGNAGGAFRQTGVDIEKSAAGGYNIGWIGKGEWMNYTVDVAATGTYTVQVRVASPSGGATMHVGFNGSRSVWKALSIPKTGSWQSWTTLSFTATIGAGRQLLTVYFDTAGANFHSVTVTGGTPTPTSAPPPPPPTPAPEPVQPPPPSPSASDVTVVTWNVQVSSSSAHAAAIISKLMALNPRPQIVVMQEAYQGLFNTYISELQARTGVTWRGVFKTHCPPGGWNGSTCTKSEDEGVGIFTTLPIQNSSSLFYPYADSWHSARAALRAAISVNGVTLQVFTHHLIPNNAEARYGSMSRFKTWASGYSKPQIVGGDFNADPDQIRSSRGMSTTFRDASQLAGNGNQLTAFAGSPTMKLDYWFSDSGGKASPQWAVVPNTSTTSDHLPVLVSYRISP